MVLDSTVARSESTMRLIADQALALRGEVDLVAEALAVAEEEVTTPMAEAKAEAKEAAATAADTAVAGMVEEAGMVVITAAAPREVSSLLDLPHVR